MPGYRWLVEFESGPWPDKLASGWRNARDLGGGRAGADGALDVAGEAVDAGNRLAAYVADFSADMAAREFPGPAAAVPPGGGRAAGSSQQASQPPARQRKVM